MGFEPFGGAAANTSRWIAMEAARLRGDEPVVLPVAYEEAADLALEAIAARSAEAVVLMGMSGPERIVGIEALAVNEDRCTMPDNRGVLRETGAPIAADGPTALEGRWDFEGLRAAFIRRGVPARISRDAGRFLCNHLYYEVLRRAPASTRCVFLHVPGPAGPNGGWSEAEARAFARALLSVMP